MNTEYSAPYCTAPEAAQEEPSPARTCSLGRRCSGACPQLCLPHLEVAAVEERLTEEEILRRNMAPVSLQTLLSSVAGRAG